MEEFELIISRVIDLVSCRDARNLSSFLATVLLDLTKVYDERGYTLVHICCMNSDAKTLDVLINQQFKYWEITRRVSKQETLDLLHDWVNQESLPPERHLMIVTEVSRDLVDDRGFRIATETNSANDTRSAASKAPPVGPRERRDRAHEGSAVVQEDDGVRPIHFASYHQNVQLLDILLNSGADPTLPNNRGLNVLHMAAQGDCPYSLILFKQSFENIRQDINIKDHERCTPLHWACYCNSHKIINFLISLGADVNARDMNGETPLHIALKRFDWKDSRKSLITIQRLYNSGADPRLRD